MSVRILTTAQAERYRTMPAAEWLRYVSHRHGVEQSAAQAVSDSKLPVPSFDALGFDIETSATIKAAAARKGVTIETLMQRALIRVLNEARKSGVAGFKRRSTCGLLSRPAKAKKTPTVQTFVNWDVIAGRLHEE